MKNFPWIDKKISSINMNKLSHALIVEGQEGVGKNQICQYLINSLLKEKNSQNLIKNNSHPDLFCINNETLISYFQREDKVKLKNPLPYLKTSENMPMLRPPDLVAIDEVGEIISIKTPSTVEIKFRRGSFLIDTDKIEKI